MEIDHKNKLTNEGLIKYAYAAFVLTSISLFSLSMLIGFPHEALNYSISKGTSGRAEISSIEIIASMINLAFALFIALVITTLWFLLKRSSYLR